MTFDLTNPFARRPRLIAGLPRIVRIYVASCLIGFTLAAVFAGLLVGFDIAGLRSLIATVEGGGLAVFLLIAFNGIVFSGVQFGITVMAIDRKPPAKPRPGLPATLSAQRARAPARSPAEYGTYPGGNRAPDRT